MSNIETPIRANAHREYSDGLLPFNAALVEVSNTAAESEVRMRSVLPRLALAIMFAAVHVAPYR